MVILCSSLNKRIRELHPLGFSLPSFQSCRIVKYIQTCFCLLNIQRGIYSNPISSPRTWKCSIVCPDEQAIPNTPGLLSENRIKKVPSGCDDSNRTLSSLFMKPNILPWVHKLKICLLNLIVWRHKPNHCQKLLASSSLTILLLFIQHFNTIMSSFMILFNGVSIRFYSNTSFGRGHVWTLLTFP